MGTSFSEDHPRLPSKSGCGRRQGRSAEASHGGRLSLRWQGFCSPACSALAALMTVCCQQTLVSPKWRVPPVGKGCGSVCRAGPCRLTGAGVAEGGRNQYCGMATRSPPFRALSWAQIPTRVQLAAVGASGKAGCSPSTAMRKLWAKWGWLPPCPPPWTKLR